MTPNNGMIALMGSGELTATMVEVHKELLAKVQPLPRAVFLDTPAGFQLNADHLSRKAVAYFHDHVQQAMQIVSFKAKETTTPFDAEQAFHALREANYVLIGPGSPTYAIRNWQQTPIPEVLTRCVENGGCLVAASAAALTVGRFALPVYEIYKVGQDLHWVEGLNLLAHFGLNLVVVPHWNNAEGGTHDTRFCYMGATRFEKLQSFLPEDVTIFGLDEHTACVLDLEADEAVVRGIGRVTVRNRGVELTFAKGEHFPLGILRGGMAHLQRQPPAPPPVPDRFPSERMEDWSTVHTLETAFHAHLEGGDAKATASTLLELDRLIWQARQEGESEEFIAQAREVLRELIVSLGMELDARSKEPAVDSTALIASLLELRERFRRERKWEEADAVRECLRRADIVIEDTRDGPRWHMGA